MDQEVDYDHIIGMTLDEAEKASGLKIRPTMINGQHMIVTRDYRLDRLNVSLKDGRIISVSGLG